MLDLLIWPNYHYIYLLLVLLGWLHYRSYSQHNNRQQATQQPPGVERGLRAALSPGNPAVARVLCAGSHQGARIAAARYDDVLDE